MTILNIISYPDKFLRQPTKQVKNIDDIIQKLIEDMAETMFRAPGLGLAAIQVGVDKNLFVYSTSSNEEEKKEFNAIINPEIVDSEGEKINESEGCLSVPDFRADVKRYERIFVKGLNREGNPISVEADGLLSLIFQHEIDHLNGILFIDKISALKREIYKRRLKKRLKNDG